MTQIVLYHTTIPKRNRIFLDNKRPAPSNAAGLLGLFNG